MSRFFYPESHRDDITFSSRRLIFKLLDRYRKMLHSMIRFLSDLPFTRLASSRTEARSDLSVIDRSSLGVFDFVAREPIVRAYECVHIYVYTECTIYDDSTNSKILFLARIAMSLDGRRKRKKVARKGQENGKEHK